MPTGKLAIETRRHDAPEHAVFQIPHEIADIGEGLQADQVIGGQIARQLLMLGDGHEGLPGRNRNVQIEADGVLHTELPQFAGEGDQMVVVHPDQVVGLQQRQQQARQPLVDGLVTLEIAGLELGQVQAVVEHRP
jgi:hypothetical protein